MKKSKIRHRISELADKFLRKVPYFKKIYTIEDDIREIKSLLNSGEIQKAARRALIDERKALHWIVRNELTTQTYNIEHEAQLIARAESLAFVEENFSQAVAFSSREEIREYALKNAVVDGLNLEFGVFEGASINYFARLSPEKIFHGFDSFEGLPDDWIHEHPKGKFALSELPEFLPNVKIVKGIFSDTLPGFLLEHNDNISFVHVDCDLYESSAYIFKLIQPRLLPGSIILFDEFYNYPGWQNGEFKAFKELVDTHSIQFNYIAYNRLQRQVAIKLN